MAHYLAALLAGTRTFSEATADVVDADVTALTTCFEQFVKPERVRGDHHFDGCATACFAHARLRLYAPVWQGHCSLCEFQGRECRSPRGGTS